MNQQLRSRTNEFVDALQHEVRVDLHVLRELGRNGGIPKSVRPRVWKYLLGLSNPYKHLENPTNRALLEEYKRLRISRQKYFAELISINDKKLVERYAKSLIERMKEDDELIMSTTMNSNTGKQHIYSFSSGTRLSIFSLDRAFSNTNSTILPSYSNTALDVSPINMSLKASNSNSSLSNITATTTTSNNNNNNNNSIINNINNKDETSSNSSESDKYTRYKKRLINLLLMFLVERKLKNRENSSNFIDEDKEMDGNDKNIIKSVEEELFLSIPTLLSMLHVFCKVYNRSNLPDIYLTFSRFATYVEMEYICNGVAIPENKRQTKNNPTLRGMLSLFLMLCRHELTELMSHFDHEELYANQWALDWIKNLFVGVMEWNNVIALWDIYLCYGIHMYCPIHIKKIQQQPSVELINKEPGNYVQQNKGRNEGMMFHMYCCIAVLMMCQEDLLELDHAQLKAYLHRLPWLDINQVVTQAANIREEVINEGLLNCIDMYI